MTIGDKLKRIAKLEKCQRRYSGGELTDVQLTRAIGYCLTCAAYGYGSERQLKRAAAFCRLCAHPDANGRGLIPGAVAGTGVRRARCKRYGPGAAGAWGCLLPPGPLGLVGRGGPRWMAHLQSSGPT